MVRDAPGVIGGVGLLYDDTEHTGRAVDGVAGGGSRGAA